MNFISLDKKSNPLLTLKLGKIVCVLEISTTHTSAAVASPVD